MSKEIQCERCGRKFHGICECDYPMEDEFIVRLCVGLAESVRFWTDNHQKARIDGEVDKFAIGLTAYMHGFIKGKR